MTRSSLESLRIKAKLLQKKKRQTNPNFALKDAYQLIARTAGHTSWKEMKDTLALSDLLNPPRWSAIWKNWISTHEEARSILRENQFLLPYRDHYFICNADYLEALGLDLSDSDLRLVGADWTRAKDKQALRRLFDKIAKHHAI